MAAIVRDTGLQTGSAVGTDSASFSVLPAVNNHIIIGTGIWEVSAPNMTGCSDNQSNTYIENIERQGPSVDCGTSIYSAKVNTSSGTFTVTVDPAGSVWIEWIAVEVSGLDATTHIDQTGTGLLATGTGTVTASGANSTSSGIAIAVIAVANEVDTNINLAPDTYTALATNDNASNTVGYCFAYKIYSSSETSSETFTHDTGSQVGWTTCIATYKDDGGGGGSVARLLTILGAGQ